MAIIDPEEIIRAGLENIDAAVGQIEHEAERIALIAPPTTPAERWRLTPTTRLDVSRGILAQLWKRYGIAIVGQIEDEFGRNPYVPHSTLVRRYELDEASATAILNAMNEADLAAKQA